MKQSVRDDDSDAQELLKVLEHAAVIEKKGAWPSGVRDVTQGLGYGHSRWSWAMNPGFGSAIDRRALMRASASLALVPCPRQCTAMSM
jgi:hypothetical protein